MFPTRDDWRCLALVAAVVFLTAAFYYRASLLSTDTEVDLGTYRAAFDRVEAGLSPYEDPAFLYPPAFAVVGAGMRDALGWRGFQLAFRGAMLAGVVLLLWASLAGSHFAWKTRAAIAFGVTVSPLVANGVGCGNVTPMLLGLSAIALRLAERWPVLAGTLAGGIHALKPLALPALAVTAAAPRGRPWAWRFALAAAVTGLATLPIGRRFLPDMLVKAGGLPDAFFNLSLVRALGLLGLVLHPVTVFLAVSALGIVVARRYASNSRERMAVGLGSSLLALPVIGTSAFLFSLPLQVLALERVARQLGEARTRRPLDRSVLVALALVSAVILSVHGAEGGVAASGHGDTFHGAVMLIPLLDVVLLAACALFRPLSLPTPP